MPKISDYDLQPGDYITARDQTYLLIRREDRYWRDPKGALFGSECSLVAAYRPKGLIQYDAYNGRFQMDFEPLMPRVKPQDLHWMVIERDELIAKNRDLSEKLNAIQKMINE